MIGFRVWGLGFSLIALVFLYPIPYVREAKASSAYTLYPSYAADSTPSADIKAKLEELKKEIASKAAKLKTDVNRKLNNKAYVGGVKTKSSTSLTLASSSGPKLVSINQDTIFESKITHPSSGGKTKKNFSSKTLLVEDYIAALGDIDETQVLTAKKIILLAQPKAGQPLAEKTYLWGKIVSKDLRLATLLDHELKNVAVSIPKDVSIKVSDFVIVTGTKNKNEIFEAEFVYVIPQGGVLKPKKVATPSATLKPSPSVNPATKSATPR